MSNWISIKDRLPLDDESDSCVVTVIAANGYGVIPLDYERETVRGKTVYRWKRPGGKLYDGEPVTHWMPLPEPPEENGQGGKTE